MAIYKIASLNYITAGSNRAFVNMDTILDYELCKPNYILRNEEPYISPNAVSVYQDYNNIKSDWSNLSNTLSLYNDPAQIELNWTNISNEVLSIILDDMKKNIASSSLSVLSSNILTEQKDGNWLKTEYLAKEFTQGPADNYAIAGDQDSSNIILNEQQKYYNELSDGYRKFIKIYPNGTDKKTIQKIEEFNNHRLHINRTFVLDTNLASRRYADGYDGIDSSLNNINITTSNNPIYPMYDIVDVHIKSADKSINSNLKKFDANVTGKREDIYLPQLKSNPIGLCQVQNNAFILTEATNIESGILKSSLHKERLNKDTTRIYNITIEHDSIKTYLYKKDNNIIDIQNTPQSNIAGIKYNNIIEFPQNDIKVGYSEGNEYGYITKGKNTLDSQYNMNLDSNKNQLSVYNCRNYIGINQFAGNQLYYKFYDNISYEGISTDTGILVEETDKSQLPIVSYQKIETSYINKYSSTNAHKTRFFSIKMMNTELGQYQNIPDNTLNTNSIEFQQKKLYSQIMQDLQGAIKEIVENLQPAHTQLYKVMFDS